MIYAPLDDFVEYRSPVIPSVEPEEVLVNISLEVLSVTIEMHPAEPVLEVPDLYVQHGKVLAFDINCPSATGAVVTLRPFQSRQKFIA